MKKKYSLVLQCILKICGWSFIIKGCGKYSALPFILFVATTLGYGQNTWALELEDKLIKIQEQRVQMMAHFTQVDQEQHWSESESFRIATGWDRQGENKHKEIFEERFPDDDVSPHDTFVYLAADYYLNYNFRCVHPLAYHWFKKHLGPRQGTYSNCFAWYDPIDPDQVSKISMIYVGPGKNRESMFGHLALKFEFNDEPLTRSRIVEFAPSTTGKVLINGLETRKELEAKSKLVEGSSIFSPFTFVFESFFGTLPLNLVLSRFYEFQNNAVIKEQRELQELPIELDSNQKKAMAMAINFALLTLHSRYSLLFNNCTHPIVNLLERVRFKENNESLPSPVSVFLNERYEHDQLIIDWKNRNFKTSTER
jgi:hypothetical protein